MDYVISEDDLNRLEDSMNMLGMVSTLLAQVVERGQLAMTTAELYSFMSTQADTLRQVIRHAHLLHEVEKDADRRLNALDWLTVMDVCAGKLHRPPAHAEKTTRKFEALAAVQTDMAVVLDVWNAAQRAASGASSKTHLIEPQATATALPTSARRKSRKGVKA